jgi:hypothetical protein
VNNSLIKFLRGKGAILNYHRVLPSNKIDNSLVNISVSTDNFTHQINYLKNNFDIISLDDLLLHLKSKSNEFKIAITFDDGYSDNLDYAYPILEKLKAPATIYIITKFINNKVIPWWIKLDHFIKNNSKIFGDKKKIFEFYKNDILLRDQLTIDKKILSIRSKLFYHGKKYNSDLYSDLINLKKIDIDKNEYFSLNKVDFLNELNENKKNYKKYLSIYSSNNLKVSGTKTIISYINSNFF